MSHDLSAELEEVGSIGATPGSRDWALAMRLELRGALNSARHSAHHLTELLRLFAEYEGYRRLRNQQGAFFATYEEFCTARRPWGLGYAPQDIARIIEERKSAEAAAREAKKAPLAKPGRPAEGKPNPLPPLKQKTLEELSAEVESEVRAERGAGKGSDRTFSGPRGETQSYLARRIARDRPDILARMEAGEYRSVRAAAIEAGIVHPATPLILLKRAWTRATEQERAQFLDWMNSHDPAAPHE